MQKRLIPNGCYLKGNVCGLTGLAKKALVQLSYAIGVAKPTSITVDTMGTNSPNISDEMLSERIAAEYSLTPRWITEKFKLNQPSAETFLYADVAARGQVGQSDYPWEKLDALAFFERMKG